MMVKNQILFILSALLVGATASAKVESTQLNREIQKAGANWVAKDNWMTELDKATMRRMMGVKLQSGEGVEFSVKSSGTRGNYPAVVDWRNKDGQNWVSPILNQANCGSCVAFASIGVLETQYRISSAFPWFNIKLSPQNLFSCGGGSCDFGWQPQSAASFLQKTGVTDEACMPYQSGATSQDVACTAACADSKQRTIKISGFTRPTTFAKNLDAIRAALQKGPLVTTLTVYTDFLGYAGGVYKHVTGNAEGGHAISIVGYDDTKQAFIIRNSWGHEWGEDGFGYVSYDDASGVGDETWLFNVNVGGAVSVESPMDRTYYSGTVPFKAGSTFANAQSVDMKVTDGAGRAVWSGTCAALVNSNCSQDISVAGYKDGQYDIQAVAVDANGKTLGTSTHQIFYVANSQPKISVSFTGRNGLDLTKPLSGRPEFDITTSSTSVPLSSIEFHFMGADGKDRIKSADIILDQMTMGWRTTTIPNGQYQIWMVGHVTTNGYDVTYATDKKTVTVQN